MEDSKSSLNDQEESVRIAVKALGDMRNSTSASRPPPPPPSSSDTPPPAFVARMSHLPFVNSALRVYEQGKASSRMVKYGAEMVESSVKTMVINRLPNQLDEFACRQLDRLDRYRHPSSAAENQGSSSSRPMTISPDPTNTDRERGAQKAKMNGSPLEDDDDDDDRDSRPASSDGRRHHWRESDRDVVPGWLEANRPFIITPPPPPPDSRASTPTQNGDESRSEKSDSWNPNNNNIRDERQVAQRSRWQAMLLEAGGLSAALSEESMRRLKYCLQWLQYATAYIDAHILFLRNFTADLQPLPSDTASSTTRRPPISEEHMRRLMDVRRDIVHTIRQVVDIVSKYAGGALPEPAKTRVRGFILTLPQRWATKAGVTGSGGMTGGGGSERDSTVTAAASGTGATRRPGGQRRAALRERGASNLDGGGGGGMRSGASSRASSPSSSPRVSRGGGSVNSHLRHNSGGGEMLSEGGGENGRVSAGTALLAAQRILVLATESLDMMRNVTGVMKDSLDRAEAWVGRLRTVGIQRGTQEDADIDFSHRGNRWSSHHRRHQSSSQFDERDDNMMMTMTMPPSPFFSGSSSSTTDWGSSVPSTPGGGSGGGGGGYMGSSSSAPSPGAMANIGAMSLSSKYNTPRSGLSTLPDEEEEEEEEEGGEEEGEGEEEKKGNLNRKFKVKEDVKNGEEDGLLKMKMEVDS